MLTLSIIISPRAWENLYILLIFTIGIVVRNWNRISAAAKAVFVLSVALINIQRLIVLAGTLTDKWNVFGRTFFFTALGMTGALMLLFLQLRLASVDDHLGQTSPVKPAV